MINNKLYTIKKYIQREIIKISLHIKNALVIYTEHNNEIKERIPLFYQGERNIVLNLGCEWGVKINQLQMCHT